VQTFLAWIQALAQTLGAPGLFLVAFLDSSFLSLPQIFERYGVLAVLVPAILPPPAPFKLFVILAGVARLSPWKFVTAVAVGRGIRYFAEGLLAVWYGERALVFMNTHGREVSLWFGLTVLVAGLAYVFWHRRSRAATATQ